MRLKKILELAFYKAYTDIKAESERSYLGIIWWFFEPVLYLAAFYTLFIHVLQRGEPDFVPFFLCGAIVWKWFNSGLNAGASSIISQYGIIHQIYVPKYIFPLASVITSTAKFIPVFVIFCGFLIGYGIKPQYSWITLPMVFFAQFLLVLSGALLLGAITPFFPDIKIALESGLMFLFFLSGVFFDINGVQEPVRSYLLINPMAGLIDEYRSILMKGQEADVARLVIIMFFSIFLSALALLLLKYLDKKYAKVRF